MELDYIVLRRPDGSAEQQPLPDDELRSEGFGLSDDLLPLGHAHIEKVRLTEASAAERLRNREALTAIPVMPVSLIAPVAVGGRDDAWVKQARADRASWGIPAIGADQAVLTGAGVRVAVLDTGVDKDHAAFRGIN